MHLLSHRTLDGTRRTSISRGAPIAAVLAFATVAVTTVFANDARGIIIAGHGPIGRVDISTVPFPADLVLRSATYTPSGKVLVSYAENGSTDRRKVKLAIMDDDGRNLRPIFAQTLPVRDKDNGVRFMVFPDNKRIFLGDFIIECAPSLDACARSQLFAVDYPPEVAGGDHIAHRWSEIIVAPDNRHVAWTTLLSNYSAIVFTGELQKTGEAYKIASPRIISTLNPFAPDPAHADGMLPRPVKGGEVKQFTDGGTAISLVGAVRRDMPGSVLQHLATGRKEEITDTPGYTETTIFSPDERLGITMSSRFSPHSDPAILGLMPRPYPDSLNMGLSMLAYTYAVTGVRSTREGNIGPALIDIQASKTQEGYLGVNLNTKPDWVFHSPMSWAPGSKKAMWIEGQRGSGILRIQVARLPDYRAGAAIPAKPWPSDIPDSSTDLSVVPGYAARSESVDAKVYGRRSGYILYHRTPDGVIEKTYSNFSDDAQATYSGRERMTSTPNGRSTYMAKVQVSGAKAGTMDLKITFGPIRGAVPAQILFAKDEAGEPLTHGYVSYGQQRLTADDLLP